ncbi:MAG TPA: amino acid adenylation domain-containing protein [Nevskiaceae bacterium]|nr:amino acid adenylation domain-containing protein [Nevskiaceae bacterium]
MKHAAKHMNHVHQHIFELARRQPQSPAVRFADRTQTYEELASRAQAIANALREAGAGRGRCVAVCMERGLDMPAALLGVLSTGAAYLPIDPAFPSERIDAILEDAKAVAVLTSRDVAIKTAAPQVCVDDVRESSADAVDVSDDAAAYLIYTSGSTGKPKGVVVTHRNLANFLESMALEPGLRGSDVLLAVTTISFDIAGLELWLPLTVGATMVIASRDDAMDGERLRALIDEHKVSLMQATPSTWRLLIAAEWKGSPGFRALCGGEPLPIDLAKQLLDRGVELWNMYGPTETTIWSTLWRVTEAKGPILIGKPIANTQCYVLDENRKQCADGETGELYIGGDGVARGYHERPELTAEKFLDDPFLPGNRMYRTGDLARRHANGDLECLGRIDFQIKLRGFRIEPGDIEAALREHPAVVDAAVGVRERAPGDARLVAWIQLHDGVAIDAPQLRAHVANKLPAYMVPQHYAPIAELPRLINGKLDRKSLPDPFQQVRPEGRPTSEAPAGTALEDAIAAIWADVLGTTEPIGRDERFFERGGTSLQAISVLAKVRALIGTRVPVTKFFAAPTIAQFAAMLEKDYPTRGADASERSDESRQTLPSARNERGSGDIAVIGMACRTPGAENVQQFWQMICAGREGVRDLTDAELDDAGVPKFEREHPAYVKRGGVLKDAYAFDAEFFGYSPREAELMDPQHRVMLETAWHAMEDAGIAPSSGARVGVYVGVAHNHYFDRAVANQPVLRWGDSGFQTQLGADKDYAASRIAFKLDLRGPALALQTACSSSGVAIHLACQALRAGDCDAALAGGARVNAPDAGYVHVDGGPQAIDGKVRPFAKDASGMVLASGAACLVLKTLERAQADGDRIYAVIKGSAINNDGADKIAFTAPSQAGQVDVIRRALAQSGVDPASVGYVEAHGTGTHIGDPIEVAALAQGYEAAERIALGSVKGNVGHLDAGAGAIGLIKAALALHHKALPPSIHCDTPNPDCDFESTPFFVNTEFKPWPADGVRRAAISSFGFGGTNFHAVLEEAPARAKSEAHRSLQLLQISARDDAALQRQAKALADHLRSHPKIDLADVAYSLASGRAQLPRRAAIVAENAKQAAQLLDAVKPSAPANEQPSLVMLFPGQGAQYAGMGAQLYREERVFRERFDLCAEIAKPLLQADLRDLLYGEDRAADDLLRETRFAQPAIFAVSYATAELWRSWGLEPVAMVGHSVGEFVAATLAGVFSVEDAVRLVAQRGALMQAMPSGGMLAVRLGETDIAPWLQAGIEVAGYNAPQQTVLSGDRAALAALQAEFSSRNISATILKTSHAFHSASMDRAATAFEKIVAGVARNPARAAILSTRSGRFMDADEMCDPSYWSRQIREPVRFAPAIAELLKTPGRVFLECGPGHTLCAAVRQAIGPKHDAVAINSLPADVHGAPALEYVLGAAARLFTAGIALDARKLFAGARRNRISLPGYPFARTKYCLPIGADAPIAAPIAEAQPLPTAVAPPASNNEVADPMVAYLLGVFGELTGRRFSADQADTGFFDLGLDSLVLLQVSARLKKDLRVNLRFRALLDEHDSVSALARALADNGASLETPLEATA